MKQLLFAGAVFAAGCAHQHHGDMSAACAEYRSTIAGKPVAEQRAAAAEHIRARHGSVDEAHIDRHLAMMAQRCGPATAR